MMGCVALAACQGRLDNPVREEQGPWVLEAGRTGS